MDFWDNGARNPGQPMRRHLRGFGSDAYVWDPNFAPGEPENYPLGRFRFVLADRGLASHPKRELRDNTVVYSWLRDLLGETPNKAEWPHKPQENHR